MLIESHEDVSIIIPQRKRGVEALRREGGRPQVTELVNTRVV